MGPQRTVPGRPAQPTGIPQKRGSGALCWSHREMAARPPCPRGPVPTAQNPPHGGRACPGRGQTPEWGGLTGHGCRPGCSLGSAGALPQQPGPWFPVPLPLPGGPPGTGPSRAGAPRGIPTLTPPCPQGYSGRRAERTVNIHPNRQRQTPPPARGRGCSCQPAGWPGAGHPGGLPGGGALAAVLGVWAPEQQPSWPGVVSPRELAGRVGRWACEGASGTSCSSAPAPGGTWAWRP